MIVYHRTSYKEDSLEETIEHVRDHVASIASANDDPSEYRDQVKIQTTRYDDGSVRVFGELDMDPCCDYSVPESYVEPPEDQYQKGFGVREMTSDELQEHLLKKEGLQ
ncbi:hypothetical protein GMA7_27 [Gordonia phage GMA7]|uniref:Uncharacterized protein n=1 Tax=Gordonia phage GMA7 TaxID=1647286 RepID=A0A0K0N6B2_9CAUD|nr:hypothetical protein AU104_gp091 [Gordonia phage GMA7]AKJ72464.1 hypothetical protein GMA7_27 [Gordonia phage GMA7]